METVKLTKLRKSVMIKTIIAQMDALRIASSKMDFNVLMDRSLKEIFAVDNR